MEEKVIESYDGRKFRTKAEMCEFFGIERKTYDQRIKRGWSQEKALTEPVKTSPLKSALSEKERQSISFKKYYAKGT